jgi:DNA-binding NarL/FixJ family response regulator
VSVAAPAWVYSPIVALRVVFAEDNYLVREGTSALFAEADEIDLVAAVGDPASLLKAVRELTPDAVLTDIRMPPTFTSEGIEAAKRIRAEFPRIGVVVLSQYAEDDLAFDLLSDGVGGLGYLLKERISQVDELVRALQDVCRGGSALDPKVVEGMLFQRTRQAKSPLHDLTDKEREVLAEMAAGRNNAAIARTLFMSDRAVEKHIGVVFQKLGLVDEGENNRRVMAVLAFLEAGGAGRTR